MDFIRGLPPKESLDIGWNRKLKKGDKFRVTFPATTDNPPILREAIALNDEESFKHSYKEKSGIPGVSFDEWDFYTVRQVEFMVSAEADDMATKIGIILTRARCAEMRDNCEFPEWRQRDNPEF